MEFTLTPKQEAETEGIPDELGLHGLCVYHRILSQKPKSRGGKGKGLDHGLLFCCLGTSGEIASWREHVTEETVYCAAGKATKDDEKNQGSVPYCFNCCTYSFSDCGYLGDGAS